MTKKRSKALFILFAIILVICLFATFFSFTYPFSINGNFYRYSSFIENVNLGQDISSSLKIVYRADQLDEYEMKSNYDVLRQSTIDRLYDILQEQGYKDTTIAAYGSDQIQVNIGNILSRESADEVLSLIANPGQISFSMSNDASAAFATAADVKDIRVVDYAPGNGSTASYVLVEFNDAVKQQIADATKDGGTLYILFGDDSSSTISMSINDAIENGMITISGSKGNGSDLPWDRTDATTYANKLKTGLLDLQLVKLSDNIVEGSYGSFTRSGNHFNYGSLSAILIWVALGILMLAGFVFLIVKYKQMGWVASFNLLFFVCIGLFLLQSIPLLHVNFAGMVGIILCFALATDSLMEILERAKKYYQADAKLYIAFKTAQKESLVKIFLNNGLLILAGIICVFMPNMAIQSFGWVALVLPFVTLFASLVLFRLFIKMYLVLNNTDGKKCNFHKGGKNA